MTKANEIEPAEEIIERIMSQYSQEPRGWHVLNTPTGDLLVLGPHSTFQLRLIDLNPAEFTGVGMELHAPPESISHFRSAPDFGLRGLSNTDLGNLVKALHGDSLAMEQARDILNREPLPPSEVESKNIDHILSGPVFTRPDLVSLDPTIASITHQLSESARDLFHKKYPMRSGMFY
ncbi:MAG: hypothetical protein ACTSYL_06620 [Candidatus Thorarchaeota archaeon]